MTKQTWARRWVVVVGLAGALAAALGAQTVTGTLRGQITDPQGAALAGAHLTLTATQTGAVRDVVADSAGRYQATFLPLGSYTLAATAKGFATSAPRQAVVELNHTTVVDIQLQLAGVSSQVEVTAATAPLIDTTTATMQDTLSAETVANAPVAGRNMISLVELTTGFQAVNWNGSANNPTNSTGSFAAFDGLGSRSSTFETDGINNDDSSENQNRQGVNLSSVQSFTVLQNTFSAEFGRAAGAVVLVQTKSGTNHWHGDVFDFLQNDALNANDFFANQRSGSRPPIRYQNYGFTLGNPVWKDKVFAFTSVERVFNHTFAPPVIWGDQFTWLPGEQVHGCAPGVASTPAAPCVDPAAHPNFQADLARLQYIQSLWNTPDMKAAHPDVAAVALQGNGQPLHASCVGPNGANRCMTALLTGSYPTSDYGERMDFNLSQNDQLFARYQYSRQHANSGRLVEGDNYGSENNRQYNLGLTETHAFSPSIVGQFRFGFGNRSTLQDVTDGNSIPVVRFSGQWGGGVMGTSLNVPIDRYQEDWQYVYDVGWHAGAHNLHFGTDIRASHLDDFTGQAARGYLSFSSFDGYTALGNFLRGYANFNWQGYGSWFLQNRYHESNFYFQDDYQVRPNLTLNLGVRTEMVSPATTVGNLLPYGYHESDDLEPRLGFAWSPGWRQGWLGKIAGGPNRSSIRGGFGIYHDRIFQSIFSQNGASLRAQPPNATQLIVRRTPNIAAPIPGYSFQPGPPPAGTRLSGILQVDPNLHLPYAEEWSLSYQREMPLDSAITLSYLGNRGIGSLFYNALNRPVFPIVSPVNGVDYAHVCGPTDGTGLCPNSQAGAKNEPPIPAGYISLAVPQYDQRRPNVNFGGIEQVSNFGWSYYHAFNAEWTKRFAKGFLAHSIFSWSKSIDTGSEATTTFVDSNTPGPSQQSKNAAATLRGLSSYDIPLRWATNFEYELPFFREQHSWIGRALGGWTTDATVTMQSGNPFTVFLGWDTALDGDGNIRPQLLDPKFFGASVDNGRITHGAQVSTQQLPFAAFNAGTAIANGQVDPSQLPLYPGHLIPNSLSRNTFRAQGINNWDLAVFKNLQLTEGKNLLIRLEMYNAFNRVQFGNPDNYLSDGSPATGGSFGTIGGTVNMFNYVNSGLEGNARLIQAALRLTF